jgi:integration host factor subunit beta
MTKKDMAKAIAEAMGLTQGQAREAVQRVFDGITETLLNEGRIELRNFGVFEVKKRKPRIARNPRTGENVSVRLGGHIVAAAAGEMIHEVVAAMAAHATVPSLAEAIHAFPNFAEGVKAAARQWVAAR